MVPFQIMQFPACILKRCGHQRKLANVADMNCSVEVLGQQRLFTDMQMAGMRMKSWKNVQRFMEEGYHHIRSPDGNVWRPNE